MKKGLFLIISFCISSQMVFPIETHAGAIYHLGHGINVGVSTQQDISGKIACSLVAAALFSKIAYDMSWHNSYACRVCVLSKMVQVALEEKAEGFLREPEILEQILTLELWLRNSYASWLTPWNWVASQKDAYHLVQGLALVVLYRPLLDSENVTGQEILRHARSACSTVSLYPLMYFGQELDRHIEFVKTEKAFADMLSGLSNIKYLLRQEKEYIDELQTYETHRLAKQLNTAVTIAGQNSGRRY